MNAAEVERLIERYNAAWNAQDLDGVNSMHAGHGRVTTRKRR